VLAEGQSPGHTWGLLGLHLWDIPLIRWTPDFMQSMVSLILVYMAASMMVKISLLTLYLRLFDPIQRVRRIIWACIAILVSFYVGCIVGGLIFCLPRPSDAGGWMSTTSHARCGQPQIDISITQSIFGAVSDFGVLAIPLHLVVGLKLSLKKKIGVSAIFLTGLL